MIAANFAAAFSLSQGKNYYIRVQEIVLHPFPTMYDQIIKKISFSFLENINNLSRSFGINFTLLFFLLAFSSVSAQVNDSLSPNDYKKFSIEELMRINVTSVSKRSENLATAASAIQVITNEDIRNSGAKTLPEALRLASNLQVAQVNASQWAISARGFNNVLANKLLVMVDGRTVYTPMFAGVFWDVQNMMLDNVERIEVISGPGGALWGANAVNGVINIITKNTKETTGALIDVAYGTNMPGMLSARYGGRAGKDVTYRFYGTGFRIENSLNELGRSANDQWGTTQGGFRTDWEPSAADRVSVMANIYYGLPNPEGSEEEREETRGENIVARWSRSISPNTDFQLQFYYDRTSRIFTNKLEEDLRTYDLDWQNRFQLAIGHVLSYGIGARIMDHNMKNLELFGFFPGKKTLYLYSTFMQYDSQIIPEKLRFAVGSKVEYSTYTEFQFQPNARLTFTPSTSQTIWAAASRAIRNPSRIDRDFALLITPELPLMQGGKNFGVESVIAYELGWRYKPLSNVDLSISTFYNEYEGIRSAEPDPGELGIPITFANGVEGESYGAEIFIRNRISNWLNVRGGYTLFRKELRLAPGSADLNEATAESNDPAHQFLLQANVTVAKNFDIGTVVRYIDRLPEPRVSGYTELDLRMGWKITQEFEFSVIGQNLLNPSHTEFIAETPRREIERGVYGKLTWRR